MKALIFPEHASGAHEVGAKGWSLAFAERHGMRVPPWLAVSPEAPCGADGLPATLRAALAGAIARLSPAGEPVAVRSSAADEDGSGASFAGQLESYLSVPPDEAAARVVQVRNSAAGARVLAYRAHHELKSQPAAPAVLVQRMVKADVAGVAFSADPVSGRRAVCVVAAGKGVAADIVSGQRDADTWHEIGRAHV